MHASCGLFALLVQQRGSGVVQPHSFVLTGAEEESSFKVAIVSTSDGFKTGDVEQFADVQAVNSMSLQALVSCLQQT